jgi:hypothetical protein
LQNWVSYAQEKGIIVLFELFDSWGLTNSRYARFHPFYQLVKSDLDAFTDSKNSALLNLQKRYTARVLEALRPNLNVILGVMNAFNGDKQWHYAMSSYLKRVTPEYLVSGSNQNSPAVDDPNADIGFVHTGRYDFDAGESHIGEDIRDLQRTAGDWKMLGFSTAGFGSKGRSRENPTVMRRLARDALNAGVMLLGFLDHNAYTSEGIGDFGKANVSTYRAIAEVFQPSPAPRKNLSQGVLRQEERQYALMGEPGRKRHFVHTTNQQLPPGYLDIFRVADLPSAHPAVFLERGGKAIRATNHQGLLCFGQYRKGYPTIPLRVIFSALIDNNTADDCSILLLDVYDRHTDTVLVKTLITRKDFPKANEFCLFPLDFTPPDVEAEMEFRMYYMGAAYVLVDTITVVDPAQISSHSGRALSQPAPAGQRKLSTTYIEGRGLVYISAERSTGRNVLSNSQKLRPLRATPSSLKRVR